MKVLGKKKRKVEETIKAAIPKVRFQEMVVQTLQTIDCEDIVLDSAALGLLWSETEDWAWATQRIWPSCPNQILLLQDVVVGALAALQASASHRGAVEVLPQDVKFMCKMFNSSQGLKALKEFHQPKKGHRAPRRTA